MFVAEVARENMGQSAIIKGGKRNMTKECALGRRLKVRSVV